MQINRVNLAYLPAYFAKWTKWIWLQWTTVSFLYKRQCLSFKSIIMYWLGKILIAFHLQNRFGLKITSSFKKKYIQIFRNIPNLWKISFHAFSDRSRENALNDFKWILKVFTAKTDQPNLSYTKDHECFSILHRSKEIALENQIISEF